MGIIFSESSRAVSRHNVDERWYCPKCATSNPKSSYPHCLKCAERDEDRPRSRPNIPVKASWLCDACSTSNPSTVRNCNNCGCLRKGSNEPKHSTVRERVLSAMRPMSVAVNDRLAIDESSAEKLSRDAIRFCQQNNVHFVDDQFPPSDSSLGTLDSRYPIQWLPLANIAPFKTREFGMPWTITNHPEPSDIHQGELGDCWLLAALALITERPHMLRHILMTRDVNREGVYVVRICYNGIWKAVLLDDCFPCTIDNRLIYSRASRRQLYVPLIEKTCAKLYGSYANLSGGTTAEGLLLLTGAPCDHIDLHLSNETVDSDIVWAKILSACESDRLIGASTGCTEDDKHVFRAVGLNPNHAFTVLNAKALPNDEGRFLLLRDPHGVTHYSEDLITPSISSRLRSMYGDLVNSSGMFWMAWLKFISFFDSITISTYVSEHYDIRKEARFSQSSTDLVPAYYFTVPKTSLITVSLIYHRQNRKERNKHTQSFVLCDVDEETGNYGTKESIFVDHRGTLTHWSGSLRPGAYVIIPLSISFWKDFNNKSNSRTRDFSLVIHSSIKIDGILIEEPATLLADCLIASVMKLCKTPKLSDVSVLYSTPRHITSNIVVIENQLTDAYITFEMSLTNSHNILHSRCSSHTTDCIPPRHRQVICILDLNPQHGQAAYASYMTSQRISRGWHDAKPTIDLNKNDLHSPRPF